MLLARRSAVDVRREALTQLRAVIVTAPEPLRQELCRLPEGKLLDRCSRFRRTSSAGADELATAKPPRHRLSRGGDRQLNRALHTIVLHRCQLITGPAERLTAAAGVGVAGQWAT